MWPALGGSLRSWATTSRRVRLRSGGDRHGSPVLADAIYQNLNIVADDHLDYILVLGADHIYRMDPRQMLARHIETRAPATLVAVGVPAVEAGSFAVVEPGQSTAAQRVAAKPPDPVALADGRDELYASMGTTC